MAKNKGVVVKMKTLEQYIKKDLGYVSKWWKWALIIWLTLEIVLVLGFMYTYSFKITTDEDLNEAYFHLDKKIIFMGWYDAE